MCKRFDAFEEFRAGRYEYNEKLGFGKFARCYYKYDFCGLAKSVNSHYMLPAVIEHLPQGCFVPLGKHIEQWAEYKLGKDWRTNVDGFSRIFVKDTEDFCDDFWGGLLITAEHTSKSFPGDDSENLLCYRVVNNRSEIGTIDAFHAHWLFQFPVFFTKEFYEANVTM